MLTSCAPSASQIQDAIKQTQAASTPVPTQTAFPTYTPVPSIEVTRIVEVTPINTPLVSDVPLVKYVIRDDTFDGSSASNWDMYGTYTTSNNNLILGPGLITSHFNVIKGDGGLLLFRTKPSTTFYIVFEWGPFNDASYRGFWFVDSAYNVFYKGPAYVQQDFAFAYKPDTWYYLLMWLNPDSAQGKIWEKDHPEIGKTFKMDTPDFTNSVLHYTVNIPINGSIEIANFQEVKFVK
ncbi:MAG TPA: hypothetical protein VFA52_00085 [Candidatus Paceibacterota bacterium]|nr:hypothetical protein [Candidatus Paceibacterota bacterium]